MNSKDPPCDASCLVQITSAVDVLTHTSGEKKSAYANNLRASPIILDVIYTIVSIPVAVDIL